MKTDLATGPCPRIFRSSDKTNDLILLAKYEDSARARQLFQSAESREATRRTGVTAPPEVTMAGQVHQVPAELVQASVWFERYNAANPAPNRAGPRVGGRLISRLLDASARVSKIIGMVRQTSVRERRA